MGNKLGYPEVDLTGKVAFITGGNTGIGYQTAKGLARLGAHTFIACRSKERAENAIAKMKEEIAKAHQDSKDAAKPVTTTQKEDDPSPPNEDKSSSAQDTSEKDQSSEAHSDGDQQENNGSGDDKPMASASGEEVKSKVEGEDQQSEAATGEKDIKIEYLPLDLGSFESTKECVRLFKERDLPLHILINNAALLGPVFTTTTDDLECQIQINHLDPVLLTLELLPILLDTAESSGDVRIIFVSSAGHSRAEHFNPDTLVKTKENYSRLTEYCNTKLYNVRTEIDRSFNDMTLLMAAHTVGKNIIARTPVEGAATTLNCAVNPELNSQQHFYYDSCKTKVSSVPSRNEEFQEQMWKKTFELLKDHLSPETIEKYGPKEEVTTQIAEATETGEVQEKEDDNAQKSDDAEEETREEGKSDAEKEAENEEEGSTQKSDAGGTEEKQGSE